MKEQQLPFLDISKDPISPRHYQRGKIEVFDFIQDQGLSFPEGNVVKYLCRWREKNGIEDLKKAAKYLDLYIQWMEKNAQVPNNLESSGQMLSQKPLLGGSSGNLERTEFPNHFRNFLDHK